MPASRTVFFTCGILCYIFCFTLDNNVGCGSLSLLFLLYVCVLVILKSSYAQEALHNSQDFTSQHMLVPWNASASPLPLQIPTLEVGHSSDIPFHEASAVLLQSKEIHLSSDSHSSLFQFIFHFIVSLSVWVIVIDTSVFSSSYHSCEQGVFVFNLSQCLAYGRC